MEIEMVPNTNVRSDDSDSCNNKPNSRATKENEKWWWWWCRNEYKYQTKKRRKERTKERKINILLLYPKPLLYLPFFWISTFILPFVTEKENQTMRRISYTKQLEIWSKENNNHQNKNQTRTLPKSIST